MKIRKSILFASQLALGTFLFTQQTIHAQEVSAHEETASLVQPETAVETEGETVSAEKPVSTPATSLDGKVESDETNEGGLEATVSKASNALSQDRSAGEDRSAADDNTDEEKEEPVVRAGYYAQSDGRQLVVDKGQDRANTANATKGEAYTRLPEAVKYEATLVDGHHTLDTLPWGVAGYRTIKSNLMAYNRQALTVTAEATTTRAKWVKVTFDDGLTGWVDRVAIFKAEDYVGTAQSVDGQAKLILGSHTLDTRPWGTAGWRAIEGRVTKRVGQTVQVHQIVKTTRATWAYVTFPDRTAGWIDRAALSEISQPKKATPDHYTSQVTEEALIGRITGQSHTIDSLPWGIEGFKTVVSRREYPQYRGREVMVTKSVSTNRTKWLYVNVVNTGISGWIDRNAVTITGEALIGRLNNVDYYAKVTSTDHTLDSKPWGVPGYRTIRQRGQMKPYLGQTVHVAQTAQTKRADWAFIEFKDGLNGWYDKNGLEQVSRPTNATTIPHQSKGEAYTSGIRNVNYEATLIDSNHTLDTKPWGTEGYRTLRSRQQLKAYYGVNVQVTQEVSTVRANWAFIHFNDGLKGWIDANALAKKEQVVTDSTPVLRVADLSNWSQPNLSTYPADAYLFKASEGTYYKDKHFETYVAQAERAHKPWGAYHFLNKENWKQQADFYINVMGNRIGKGLLALDYEMYGRQGAGVAKQWLDYVYQRTGVKPVLYMNTFDEAHDNWSGVANSGYKLWLANWRTNNPNKRNVPAARHWNEVTMWQYGSKPYDQSFFYGGKGLWNDMSRRG